MVTTSTAAGNLDLLDNYYRRGFLQDVGNGDACTRWQVLGARAFHSEASGVILRFASRLHQSKARQ